MYFLCAAYLATYISVVSAQVVLGGQVFTDALAIVDSPQPNSVFHAGSPLPFAVDVSGDGKLSSAAALPNSGLSTSFESLEVYLISNQCNLTISAGPGLLTQEAGSTVKHINWPVPDCILPGAYNLTIYEGSNIQGDIFFSITPIPVEIQNNAPSGNCTSGVNILQSQPQPSNPPPQSPWIGPNPLSITPQSPTESPTPFQANSAIGSSSSIAPYVPTGVITVTIGPSGLAWPLTIVPPGVSETIVIIESSANPSPSSIGASTMGSPSSSYASSLAGSGSSTGIGSASRVSRVTVMVTPTETPLTIVFVSVETVLVPTTAPGETAEATSILTMMSTATGYMAPTGNPKGFLPINGALSGLDAAFTLVWTVTISTVSMILCS